MTDVRKMYEKDFLYAYDLENRDVTVTIARVVAGTLTGTGGKSTKKPVLYFEGRKGEPPPKKGLGLCITNARTIAALYGGFDSEMWVGKKITLYATTTQFGPNTVDCIRIRNKIPEGKAAVIRDDVPTPAESGTADDDPHEATA